MMEKEWDWFGKTNKKEAIKNELEPLVMKMISDDVEFLIVSPQVGAILNECDNMFVVSTNQIIPHKENLNLEHVFYFYKNKKIINVYVDINKIDLETIDFISNKGIDTSLRVISNILFSNRVK